MFHYIHTFIMFKHVNFGKHIWIHTSKILKKKHAHFTISSWDDVFARLIFFFSSRDDISSLSLSAFTCYRDEISSRDETRPGMKKFLFTREFHPGMKRVEFYPGMKFNLKENLPVSMKAFNKIYPLTLICSGITSLEK